MRPRGALQGAQAEVGEVGRSGAELGHHDPDVGLVPRLADGVLDEATLVGERLQVLADVDDPVSGRNEAEVGGHLGHRTVGVVIAVDGRRLQDGDVAHAVTAEVTSQDLDHLGARDIGTVPAVVTEHETDPDGRRRRAGGYIAQAGSVQALLQYAALSRAGTPVAHDNGLAGTKAAEGRRSGPSADPGRGEDERARTRC